MLKIYTYLTDQEMSFLKFQRRSVWHAANLDRDHLKSARTTISDQELSQRGVRVPQEPYVEYNKRPPHDFYL
jgi:hypothetical protein